MSPIKLPIPFLCLVLGCAGIFQPALFRVMAAEATPPSQQELEQINQAISQIEDWLTQAIQQRPDYEQTLAAVEKELNDLILSADSTRTSIASTESQLEALHQRSTSLSQAKTQQTELVQQALRAAYMDGSQSYLKLLLNQEDPALTSRMLHYYQSFSRARVDQIKQYQSTLSQLADTEQRLQTTRDELEKEKRTLEQQSRKLTEVKRVRTQALEEFNQSIRARNGILEKLVADREALEKLIEQVNRAIENIPLPQGQIPFARLKGNLPWPGQGHVLNRFGSSYGNGSLHRQGVTLASETGSPVRAIHSGRVVFSDWLRGSGLLVIIDHGDGYMSLYGHNETLTRTKGSWINTGDTVATAGNSGGQEQTGIYFEIRHNGRPQDPTDWCLPQN